METVGKRSLGDQQPSVSDALSVCACAAVQGRPRHLGDRLQHSPAAGESPVCQLLGDSRFIARQDKKPYESAEAAQRYIQGRFNLYAHLFTELSPPVPNDCKRMFMVNGHLLPGYTLAPPERTKEEAVNDLLDCLEDGDVAPPMPEPEAPATPKQKAAQPDAKKKTGPKKSAPKKSGPVR